MCLILFLLSIDAVRQVQRVDSKQVMSEESSHTEANRPITRESELGQRLSTNQSLKVVEDIDDSLLSEQEASSEEEGEYISEGEGDENYVIKQLFESKVRWGDGGEGRGRGKREGG